MTIDAAVEITSGTIINGAANSTSALIYGIYSAIAVLQGGTVINYGAIQTFGPDGHNSTGVSLAMGGLLINGSQTDDKALIAAYFAVSVSAARVNNFGTIEGQVDLYNGSSLVNEASNDRAAGISAVKSDATSVVTNYATIGSVYLSGALFNKPGALVRSYQSVMVAGGGSVTNQGSIEAVVRGTHSESAGDYGVQFTAGGRLFNGEAGESGARITGYGGVQISGGVGFVTNYGAIEASGTSGQFGVDLTGGGEVANGSATTPQALISGMAGLYIATDGTVTNLGTISGTGGAGVDLGAGGVLTNGESGTLDGEIDGDMGASLTGVTARNFGAILGMGGSGSGIQLNDGSSFTNGASGDKTIAHAYVHGTLYGVITSGGGNTIVNYGVLKGGRGAVKLTSATDTLVVESGAVFVGALIGGGGTLELAGGHGTITGLGGSGAMTGGASASFSGFNSYVVDAAATLTLTGANTLATGQSPTVAGSLVNTGTLTGPSASGYGVVVQAGGSLTNGSAVEKSALISGYYDGVVATGGPAAIANFGTIQGGAGQGDGVFLEAGGSLTNGASTDTSALIYGDIGLYARGSATVTNFGTIEGGHSAAVDLGNAAGRLIVEKSASFDGGQLIGGGGTLELAGGNDTITGLGGSCAMRGSTSASFSGFGAYVVDAAASLTLTGTDTLGAGQSLTVAGSLVNTGSLTGPSASGYGVILEASGSVTNGSAGASIAGYADGVIATGGPVAIANFGTIQAESGQGVGVFLEAGGSVINGSATDTKALIYGDIGVSAGGSTTVTNFGTIEGGRSSAVEFGNAADRLVVEKSASFDGGELVGGGGTLELAGGNDTITGLGGSGVMTGSTSAFFNSFNGYVVDTAATLTLTGASTLAMSQSLTDAGSLVNTGTISDQIGAGVDVTGGRLVNGATNITSARIQGYDGARLYGASLLTNFGTIQGAGSGSNGVGAYVSGSGVRLTNGAAGHAGAVIEAYYMGLEAVEATDLIVTNFGTIKATGAGVDTSAMAIDFGASSDTLVVEAGCAFVGAVDGGGGVLELGSGAGTITNAFAGGVLRISGLLAATTSFGDFGKAVIAAPATITLSGASGAIAAGQSLVDEGTLTVAGALAGAGTLGLDAGTTTFAAGANLTLAKVGVTGAKTVVDVATSLTYAGAWLQAAGVLSVAPGDSATFSGKSNTFTGTLAGAGAVEFYDGSDIFSNLTLSANRQTVKASTITLSGVIDLTTSLDVTTPDIIVAAGGASLTGGGALVFSATAANSLRGATASTTLTDNGKIEGAGQIGAGEMTLVIGSGGFIDGDDTLALTINTGTNTIANAGVIYAVGAGGVVVDSAVDNTGKLYADGGILTLKAAVTGSGDGYINGGTLDAASTFTQNVTFLGTTGVLELVHSQTYTGDITGFSKTGTTSLDLADITFTAGTTKATYLGTTTSGVLTVTSGSHTAKITLEGNYTTSTFTTSSDGHGGTKVVDPTPPTQAHAIDRTPPHAFVDAMASMGAGGGSVTATSESWRAAPLLLAAPGT